MVVTLSDHALNDPPDGILARACAVVLTGVAGFVDVVGYLFLFHVFVANMSGNSVAAGLSAAEGNWREVARRGFPILMFLVGLIGGGCVAKLGSRRWGPGRAVGVTLLLEVGLLGAFTLCGTFAIGPSIHHPPLPWEVPLVALAAVGMGVQNVTLRATGALSVYTTHVTGSLTQLADEAVQLGLWAYDRLTRRRPRAGRRWRRLVRAVSHHPTFHWMVLHAALWVAYVVGAAAGAVAIGHWGPAAMAVPTIILLLVVAVRWGLAGGAAR